MNKNLFFEKWLSKFNLGWLPIALHKERQVFKVIDFRTVTKYIFVIADSRKQVMEWIIDNGNNFLQDKKCGKDETVSWSCLKKIKLGEVKESFEIVRILENEFPKESTPIYNIIGRDVLETFYKTSLPQKKINFVKLKNIIRFTELISICPKISEFQKDWSWNYHEAVFQIGVFLKEFGRMYLIRCLYRREKLANKFIGWKVHLIRESENSQDLEFPFWNVSHKEEKTLEKVLQRSGYFPEKIPYQANTPNIERKRRFDFQKKCNFSINES